MLENNEPPINTHQSLGGIERAKSLSGEQRSEIAKKAAQARWNKISDPSYVPIATHSGILPIGGVDLECYVLQDKRRLFHKRGLARALGLKSEGGNSFMKTMRRKRLGSFLGDDLRQKTENPIIFRPNEADPIIAHGYEAGFVIDLCKAMVKAGKEGGLGLNQAFLAIQAEIIILASAKLGITALIDEATGYWVDKKREEYRELFKEFIRKEAKSWEKQFPDQFFDLIYRLYRLKRTNPNSFKHPSFFGNFIRRYIYAPLAKSDGTILEMLDEKNPVVYKQGGRRYKMFQFLEEVGENSLKQHLWQVIGIGNASKTKLEFDKSFVRAFPSSLNQTQFDFMNDEFGE